MKDLGFSPADILLPREDIDMERWAIVACDQYTSQKEYWEEADRIAGDSPSTLRLILPECYLEESDKEERIRTLLVFVKSDIANWVFSNTFNRITNQFCVIYSYNFRAVRMVCLKHDFASGIKAKGFVLFPFSLVVCYLFLYVGQVWL